MKHWSLIFFTLLAQTAVGAYVAYLGIDTLSGGLPALTGQQMILTVFILMVLGLLISLTHLGSPRNAFWAVANLRKSWLSREVLFALAFTGSIGLQVFLEWRRIRYGGLDIILMGLSLVFGVSLILSMGKLYRLRTVPIWDTALTPIGFILTSLILGGAVVGLFVIEVDEIVSPLLIALLILLAIELWVNYLWTMRWYSLRIAIDENIDHSPKSHDIILILRYLFTIYGAVIFGAFLVRHTYSADDYILGISLLVTSEILGRFMFYAAEEWTRNR
jgi:anaerobic dimethyl sulfoxide reductase subunit C (anchor subunit)